MVIDLYVAVFDNFWFFNALLLFLEEENKWTVTKVYFYSYIYSKF